MANCQTEDERTRTAELIRPILRGRDIKRYGYDNSGLYLINTHNGIRGRIPRIKIEDYPAVKAHLDQYWDRISTRADKGDTPYNLRNCAYWEDFSKPKIVWNRIAAVKQFAKVDDYIYIQDSMHFITGDKLNYICSVLNSKIIQWLLSTIIGEAAGGNAGNADNIWNLPIPLVSLDNSVSDNYLYERYNLTNEEIAFIESQQIQ
ncbi:TaqI-like C-terminal specificity domain-containing protein [Prevotella amnii]|uniref:TaqI-like C-terminal specificity domain-containing protein n=1 Tax=Prevotella amnii TaxID=419005 RepID=UPI00036B803D|nr:TaqI-like C-terminal specificity domain-containing protein [Prevotella amnii]